MMPLLTPQQLGAIETLEWLYDPGDPQRRTGRSLATAIALIRVALRYAGRTIDIRDHLSTTGPRSSEEIAHSIERMLDDDPLLRSAFLVRRGRLTFDATELAPLEIDPSTWLPRGWHSPGPISTSQARNPAAIGSNLANVPPLTSMPPAEPPVPESTLWDYVEDPTF